MFDSDPEFSHILRWEDGIYSPREAAIIMRFVLL